MIETLRTVQVGLGDKVGKLESSISALAPEAPGGEDPLALPAPTATPAAAIQEPSRSKSSWRSKYLFIVSLILNDDDEILL